MTGEPNLSLGFKVLQKLKLSQNQKVSLKHDIDIHAEI